MGIDFSLQALPADMPLLQSARRDPALGEWLVFLPCCLQHLAGTWMSEEQDPYPQWLMDEARQLLARDSEAATRHVDLGRGWYSVPYDSAHLAAVTFRGAAPLDEARGTQGMPLRWTPLAVVTQVAAFLASVSATELARFINHHRPSWLPETDQEKGFAFWAEKCTALSRFYADADERQ